MRSILWQLEKYTRKPEKLEPEIETQETGPTITITDLANSIIDPDKIDYLLGDTIKKLKDMGSYQWADVLYPIEVMAIYHLYYNHQWQVASEERTDKFLNKFLLKGNTNEFRAYFESAVDEMSKKIAITRVLLASLPHSSSTTVGGVAYAGHDQRGAKDKLPEVPFRIAAAKYLGIPPNNYDAAKLQESLHRSASIEQILLGRMGYLIIWHFYEKNKDTIDNISSSIPLLTYK